MKRKLLWKWIPRKHSLAPFHDIKSKGWVLWRSMRILASLTTFASYHCYLKENWTQTILFFRAANPTPLWISKEINLKTTPCPAYKIIIWVLFIEIVTSHGQALRLETHEHCGQWEIGAEGNQQVTAPFVLPVDRPETLWMSHRAVFSAVSLHWAVASSAPTTL